MVEDLPVPGRFHQLPYPVGRRRLAAEHQRAPGYQCGQAAHGTQRGQVRGHRLQAVDPVLGQVARDRLGIGDRVGVEDVQLAAGRQACERHRVPEVGD